MTNLINTHAHSSCLTESFNCFLQILFGSLSLETSSDIDETRLASQAANNPQAFDELYRHYVNRVYAYHLVRTGSREEAEDLTSLTFLSALEGIKGYQHKKNFGIWLFGIARHKLADHYRQPLSLPLESAVDAEEGLEESVDHRMKLQQVSRALTCIDPDRVEALCLRFFGQMSTLEMSLLLSKSEGAVRNLVYRALQDLRGQLISNEKLEEK